MMQRTANENAACLQHYTFSSTGEIRTIRDHIDCNSKNLIYMIHCLRCNKQYIGETKLKDDLKTALMNIDDQ